MGRALDETMTAPLVAQYGLAHRHLVKRLEGQDKPETDPLAALLDG